MMNNRGEKPLDLAAQYGRLQAVQMLIRAHPELLLPYKKHFDEKCNELDFRNQKIFNHSPLHLGNIFNIYRYIRIFIDIFFFLFS